jgi:hypothetical protein
MHSSTSTPLASVRTQGRPTARRAVRAACAVHDEGDGLLGLQLTPFRPGDLVAPLLALGAAAAMVEVSPRWGVSGTSPIDVRTLADRAAVELVNATHGAVDVPATVLADPHRAVARARFALAVSDGHAVIWSRDVAVLREFLRTFVDGVAGAGGPGPAPRSVRDGILDGLTTPIPADAWTTPTLDRGDRVWVLTWSTRSAGAAHAEERWVGGPGRDWRAGWAW